MDDQSLPRYTIALIGKHSCQLDDVLSNQTCEVEISRDNYAELIEHLIALELPEVQNNK